MTQGTIFDHPTTIRIVTPRWARPPAYRTGGRLAFWAAFVDLQAAVRDAAWAMRQFVQALEAADTAK